jgi:hypothetical protein
MDAELAAHYEQLHLESIEKIHRQGVVPDPFIDNPEDQRFGLTLLCRPSLEVWKNVEAFLKNLSKNATHQYTYRYVDAHVTVMPIISCEEGFSLAQVNLKDYFPLIQNSLFGISPFKILFKGAILSPSAILIKGYPEDRQLNQLRDNLRREFGVVPLKQSLDKRYQLKTAHSTVLRFKHPLPNPELLLHQIEKAKDLSFGSWEVRELEFVFNDWYQRHEKVIKLKTFTLGQYEKW